jgi:hypothetical protein
MSDGWIDSEIWDRSLNPPVRCDQCRRYLPSADGIEELLSDLHIPALCDECYRMQQRSRHRAI